MEITQIYAIVVGGTALAFLFRTLYSPLTSSTAYIFLRISKHLIYPYVLDRHALIGPWSAADVLLQVIYLAVNLFCISFRVADLSQAGIRAGTLSLINLGPLISGPQLDFLADLLGLPLKAYRCVHRSAGLVAFALAIFHVLAAVAIKPSTFQTKFQHPLIIIAASMFCLLIVLSRHIFQRPSYEIFLRTHQALAILCVYSMWQHIPAKNLFPRTYLYIFAALFVLTLALEGVNVIHRNGVFYHERSHAAITHSCGAVKLRIRVSRLLKVEPGQYINLWMPSVSFWAFLQSHPFVVTSWADTPRDTLDLFVVPCRGFTRELLDHARKREQAQTKWVMFSGPHGKSIPVGKYENVLLVADGAGIAAQLPYLKRLIHGCHARRVFTRRTHLVWQISDIGVGIAAEPLLNEALDEDKLENGGILQISKVSFGSRTTVYPGMANEQEVLEEEMKKQRRKFNEFPSKGANALVNRLSDQDDPKAEHKLRSIKLKSLNPPSQMPFAEQHPGVSVGIIDSRQGSRSENVIDLESDNDPGPDKAWQSKMLVSVSGSAETRDFLRTLVRRHLEEKVELAEVDFQPSRK